MTAAEIAYSSYWDGCYNRYHAQIHACAYRVLGDDAEAEDVVQTVFLKAWEHRHQLNSGSLSWLYRVAKHDAIDRLRLRTREITNGEWGDVGDLSGPTSDLETHVIALTRARWLRSTMSSLSHSDRILLYRAFSLGQSHRQIAAITGVPLGTIKSRIRHALRRLRHEAGRTGVT